MSSDPRLVRLSAAEKAALTSGSNFWHTTAAASVPEVMLTDGPHGVRKELPGTRVGLLDSEPSTCFPPAVALGSTWDPELVHRVGVALGQEARSMSVGVLLGPGINIKRSPLGGRNFEYYSEDPLLTGTLATEWVRGLQSQGVGASVKHFAVNSQETDRMRVSADVDERTLREIYLRAFQRVVQEAQPWTVMCAYNKVNGIYAAEHHWLLTEVLRDEWGFQGLVVSDWLAVGDRVASVRAGLDLVMPGPDDEGDRALAKAAEAGELDAAALDTAAGRVLELVDRVVAAASRDASYDQAEHHALAREAAARGIVLLKNEGGLLPLPRDGVSIAVIGECARTPRYQGGGSSHVNPTRLDNALAEMTALTSGKVTFAVSAAEAVEAARSSDVAVVFLGTAEDTEGRDAVTPELPADQLALVRQVVAANPKTVVVLSNGGVVLTTPWDVEVPALVEGWLLGQASGGAIADVLFGLVNPSGRLAETIPLRLADHPSYLDFPGEAGHVRYGEGVHVGYRGFDARGQEVAYPFGFGLSYTTFSYGAPTATVKNGEIAVRVPVTNTGERDGREVVQAYVSVPGSKVRRPPRELKGFANLAIAAGETAEAVIRIGRADLAYWDVRLGRWITEGGEYRFEIGSSSRDLRGTVMVSVVGDEVHLPLTPDSTVDDWLSDQTAAELLRKALAVVSEPQTLELLGSIPLKRLAAFPGSPITAELVEQLMAVRASGFAGNLAANG